MKNNVSVGVIGLGYVGLPLAIEFGKLFKVVGFDIDSSRIQELKKRRDRTGEISKSEFIKSRDLMFSNNSEDLIGLDFYVITVPTPIFANKKPNFEPLEQASKIVAKVIRQGSIIIYESTVYPGATEEVCVPIIEQHSGFKFNVDFYVGYSPERINPGDKLNNLTNIIKIVSGSSDNALNKINNLYKRIIKAGTYPVSSIKVAEAAKVIENTQRDLNIALINELSIIFNKLNISTEEVLKAAETKWNFISFRPGLVGGHCIGVDPYYLTHKAQEVGYIPEIILAGRNLNDNMSGIVVHRLLKEMIKKKIDLPRARILILGATFKENCPDTRNSKVFDIVDELSDFGLEVNILDPWVSNKPEKYLNYFIDKIPKKIDAVIIAVPHKQFTSKKFFLELKKSMKKCSVIFDLKYVLDEDNSDLRL